MGETAILTNVADGICTITLNRPEKYNALTSEDLGALEAAAEGATFQPDVKAIVVTGAGKAFCAGLDIKVLDEIMRLSPPERRAVLRRWNRAFTAFEVIEKPVVAALNGLTLGAGLEIALACDVRIAARGAKLGLVETRLGSIPDGGGCTRLARFIGIGRAKELIMTGGMISAEEAERIGLVNRLADAADLPRAATEFARELLQGGPRGIGVAKRLITQTFNMDVHAGAEFEALAGSDLYDTEDVKEEVKAFREKRKPEFRGR